MGCERQMEQAGCPTGGGAEGNGALLHTEEELLTEGFTQVKVLVGNLWPSERACGGRARGAGWPGWVPLGLCGVERPRDGVWLQ